MIRVFPNKVVGLKNKKGISVVIGILLIILMIVASASAFYFWAHKIQSKALATSEQYHEETLGKATTQAEFADEIKYNTFGETQTCKPASLTFLIRNSGARAIPIVKSTTYPRTEILIEDSNKKTVCLSDITGRCTETKNYLYAVVGPNITIYRSEDAVSWEKIAELNDIKALSFGEFHGSYYIGTWPNGKLFYSCDGERWNVVVLNNSDAEGISAIEVRPTENRIYFASMFNNISGIPRGIIYNSSDGLSWVVSKNNTVELCMGLFYDPLTNYIYAGCGFGGQTYRKDVIWYDNNIISSSNVLCFERFGDWLYAGTENSPDLLWRQANPGAEWERVDSLMDVGEAILTLKKVSNNSQDYLLAGIRAPIGAGSIFSSTDGSFWIVEYAKALEVPAFSVFKGSTYAIAYNETHAYILNRTYNQDLGIWEWNTAHVFEEPMAMLLFNISRCTHRTVNCSLGCDSDIPVGTIRKIRLDISDTDCDLSNYGKETDFFVKLNFGGEIILSGMFSKEALSSKIDSPCSETFPFCHGDCGDNSKCVYVWGENICACFPKERTCGSDAYPSCWLGDATCPKGYFCSKTTNESCVCEPLPVACEDSAPSCGGICPADYGCIAVNSSCYCQVACEKATPPDCKGYCDLGSCTDIDGVCGCV